MTRRLIVNADDFGQTAGTTAGIIHCHNEGIVTSASLMVRWPFAEYAARFARAHTTLSIGLHIDLGEWMRQDDDWRPLYEVVAPDDPFAIRMEAERQLEIFERLMQCPPTHLDSHQHVHRGEPARTALAEISARLGVPCRHLDDRIAYRGDFYGQGRDGSPIDDAIGVDHLIAILRALPDGVTELACHPGLGDDTQGVYVREREREVVALCDPFVRAALHEEQIQLISFRDSTFSLPDDGDPYELLRGTAENGGAVHRRPPD